MLLANLPAELFALRVDVLQLVFQHRYLLFIRIRLGISFNQTALNRGYAGVNCAFALFQLRRYALFDVNASLRQKLRSVAARKRSSA